MTRTEAPERLGQMMFGTWISQAISVAAELGIADLLAKGPADAGELSSAVGAREDGLARLMRALCSVGIFCCRENRKYELTFLGELLCTDAAGTQRAFAQMIGSEFAEAWLGLKDSVVHGTPGFDARYGKSFFEYMADNPDRWAIYDRAMNGVHGPETSPMLEAFDFGAYNSVIDVGGGNGSTLASIAKLHPHVTGTLYELPDVAARASDRFAREGLDNRIRALSGDFFENVPTGGDIYLLRHVIHDWDDQVAVKILANCCKSMNRNGRVLIAESIVPEGNDFGVVKWIDLMMLVVGGRERNAEEYEQLMTAAGLRLSRIIPTTCEISILEGVRQEV